MALTPFLYLLIWTTLSRLIDAAVFNLSGDIKSFIPACAQTCFDSFLVANNFAPVCSTSPTLQCLCSHNGSTGFTVGEGALQCIVAESRVGSCSAADSNSELCRV